MGASSSRRLGWERKTSLAVTQRFRISASVSSTFFPGALCFFPSSSRRISSSTALPSITHDISPGGGEPSRPLVRPDRRPCPSWPGHRGGGGDADEWCARRDGRGKTRGPRVSCCLPRPPLYAAQTLGPRRLAKSGRVATWRREERLAGEGGEGRGSIEMRIAAAACRGGRLSCCSGRPSPQLVRVRFDAPKGPCGVVRSIFRLP
jgi:hypothetical protein